jgi:nitroimidazol reductase NimA-like FMN-containing flavoprotein (pyridoxamine 5'-phosphate oxidase superfamily)
MPKMPNHEVDEFLDEPGHLVRIGNVDADGYPRVVPTWFIRQGDDVLFTPRAPAVFLANIRRDPRIGLSIDEEPLPYRKVTVQGDARIVHEPGEDDVWRDFYRQIVYRYIDKDAGDTYVNDTIDQPRALIAVSLADSKVTTWRMPLENEDGTGIWARRYYADNTYMASLIESGTSRNVDYMPDSS